MTDCCCGHALEGPVTGFFFKHEFTCWFADCSWTFLHFCTRTQVQALSSQGTTTGTALDAHASGRPRHILLEEHSMVTQPLVRAFETAKTNSSKRETSGPELKLSDSFEQ